jgi:hypothetical protein
MSCRAMAPSAKCGRGRAVDVDTRAHVLSSFAAPSPESVACQSALHHASGSHSRRASFAEMRSADLLERLSCVSSPSGLDAINGVQNCVRMRALTTYWRTMKTRHHCVAWRFSCSMVTFGRPTYPHPTLRCERPMLHETRVAIVVFVHKEQLVLSPESSNLWLLLGNAGLGTISSAC